MEEFLHALKDVLALPAPLLLAALYIVVPVAVLAGLIWLAFKLAGLLLDVVPVRL